ncbi:MAG: nucleotide exchange factor GrpE [bacterium]|nr:nucleotide exchange factor GrpE [bacterium]
MFKKQKTEEDSEKDKEISSDKIEDSKDLENEKIAESEEESTEGVEEIKEISKEEEYLNGLKRCQADFENYRKRQDESKKELKDFILEDLALQILPVVDNFQMSLGHIPEDQGKSPWVEGILHIQRQLETILKDNGITEIEAKEGDEFNPEIHEAIHQESENSEQKSKNKVKKIISKGYKIGEKVIRAAKVIVN